VLLDQIISKERTNKKARKANVLRALVQCYEALQDAMQSSAITSCRPYINYLVVFITLVRWASLVIPHFIPLKISAQPNLLN